MTGVSDSTVVEEITPAPRPEDLLPSFARLPLGLFLDSALRHPELGRYSFLAAEPFARIEAPPGAADPLGELDRRLRSYATERIDGLPPFQGGAAGVFGYELNRSLERAPAARWDEFGLPALCVGLYDVVLAFDHVADRAWLISQGFPEVEPAARRRRARRRRDRFLRLLDAAPAGAADRPIRRRGAGSARRHVAVGRSVPLERLCPQHPVGPVEGMTSDFSREQYLAAVRRVIEHILAGDVFQANLAQRLLLPAAEDSLDLYLRLRRCHPSPQAGYFDAGGWQVVSASPERFLRVASGCVETRPIKGTRPRPGSPRDDAAAADSLRRSAKDRAENVMIVDLLRNDLSRVCRPDSVRVTQLCEVEPCAGVLHLVSAVEGVLREGAGPVELVRAAFPGGSITGAPKVRAMEIIAELEPTARGPYCGSLGYVGFDGSMDLSILIRTITAAGGWWQLPVGGGIVVRSDPQKEYEETWHKAEGLLHAIVGGAVRSRKPLNPEL